MATSSARDLSDMTRDHHPITKSFSGGALGHPILSRGLLFGVLLLATLVGWYILSLFVGDPVEQIALLAVGVLAVAIAWLSFTHPKTVLLGILFGAQFGPLLAKITGSRLVLYASYLAPLGLLLAVFIRNIATRRALPVSQSIIVLLIVLFVSILTIQALNPRVSKIDMAVNDLVSKYLAHMAAFVLGLWLIKTRRDLRAVCVALTAAGAFAAVYGLYQQLVGYPTFEDAWAATQRIHGVTVYQFLDRRVLSTLLYSATYGLFSAICAYQSIALLSATKKQSHWLIIAAATGMMMIGSLLSLTRGVWVAVLAGVGLWALLNWRHLLLRIGIARLFLAAALVVAALLVIEPVRYRLSTFQHAFSEQYDARFSGWLGFWLPKMGDWHLFTGYGLGLVGAGADRYAQLRSQFWHARNSITDNLYVTIFVSTGIVGLLLFFVLAWTTLWRSHGLSRRLQDPFLRTYAVVLFTTFATYYVSFMSADHLTDSYPINMYFWFFVALLVKLPLLAQTNDKEPG
jgi:hypothetical protein